jgi:putative DNA primase/helicase
MSATVSVSDLASRLNLLRGRGGRGYRGTCPACSYPNAFSMKPGKGDRIGLFCASCGDKVAITDAIVRAAGGGWTPPTAAPPVNIDPAAVQRKQAKAMSLWTGSTPAAGTIADTYLTARALPGLASSLALRFRIDCPHPDKIKLPAMVAGVADVHGSVIALHRTFLRTDGGGKANVEPTRASLGPLWGGAVRLDPVSEALVIGEGIETSASAGRLLHLPAWAALSAGNLAKGLMLPSEVRRVVIAADADGPGERAALEAALRWQTEGRTVQVARPDKPGRDFNDILRGGENA